jgi:FkbM family methyltransferase
VILRVAPSPRVLRKLPQRAQNALRLAYVATRVTADLESLRTYARLSAIEVHEGRREATVDLRLRPLGGRAVAIRPSTSDIDTVWGAFARRYHLPPAEVGEPRLILDLGANIGLTMADFAVRYPRARVVGVELDDVNADLARRNVGSWADRCAVVNAAVWPVDGEAWYFPWAGGTATYRAVGGAPEGATRVPAISLASLVREHARDRPVDYMKVDVEGGERELLQDGSGWASHVRAIKVELHESYPRDACEADLKRLGFETRVDPQHRACVEGLRR